MKTAIDELKEKLRETIAKAYNMGCEHPLCADELEDLILEAQKVCETVKIIER